MTRDFDAPEQGKEMEWADMQLPICGQCPADEKRARTQGHARGLPSPNEPTVEERAIHNLTHIPYRSWCPYCVAGKRANTPHRREMVPRTIPLLSADYGFISDPGGELVTLHVVCVFPFRIMFCIYRSWKGAIAPCGQATCDLDTRVRACAFCIPH